MLTGEIKVEGLAELERKLESQFLLYPPVQTRVRDKFIERVKRRRKTAGWLNNPLNFQPSELRSEGGTLVAIGSPLNSPRIKGTAWLRFLWSLVKGSFMRRQIAAALRDIAARFSA